LLHPSAVAKSLLKCSFASVWLTTRFSSGAGLLDFTPLESRHAAPGWFGPGQRLPVTFILRLVNILNRNEKIGLVQTVIKLKV